MAVSQFMAIFLNSEVKKIVFYWSREINFVKNKSL